MSPELKRKNRIHRWFNTTMTSLVLCGLMALAIWGVDKYNSIEPDAIKNEIQQIAVDEGFKPCAYKDSLGYPTIGFGHLLKPDEKYKCITPQFGMQLLRQDYLKAKRSVERRYPWAEGEVKLVLTNMTYQLGETGLAKFKNTLSLLKQEQYEEAAMEMLDSRWYKQTQRRATRLAIRILALED